METVEVQVVQKEGCEDLPLPRYMSEHASGMDLLAAVPDPVTLDPGRRSLIPTGIHIALPPGVEAQTRPRSGLALRHGISIVNAPGTIDADYRGEIGIILINFGSEPFVVTRGMRIAQLVFQKVAHTRFEKVDVLDATARSSGGFGHTGV